MLARFRRAARSAGEFVREEVAAWRMRRDPQAVLGPMVRVQQTFRDPGPSGGTLDYVVEAPAGVIANDALNAWVDYCVGDLVTLRRGQTRAIGKRARTAWLPDFGRAERFFAGAPTRIEVPVGESPWLRAFVAGDYPRVACTVHFVAGSGTGPIPRVPSAASGLRRLAAPLPLGQCRPA